MSYSPEDSGENEFKTKTFNEPQPPGQTKGLINVVCATKIK